MSVSAQRQLRRTRSTGDIVNGRDRSAFTVDVPPNSTTSVQPSGAMQRPTESPQEGGPPSSRFTSFFGLGRNASPQRKLNIGLIQDLAWNLSQIVIIVVMLILTGTYFKSVGNSHLTEWAACDRPLGIWSCIWILRSCLSTVLSIWEYRRNLTQRAIDEETRLETSNTSTHSPAGLQTLPDASSASTQQASSTQPTGQTQGQLPYSRWYSRMTLFSSLLTLSWFIIAHILEYNSIKTCRRTSPHLWWLMFGILSIMYLMVLEVVALGIFVFIIGPILYLIWSLILFALGHHPLQNPTMIKPDVDKLPRPVVDRIPLVMYIPPPPAGSDTMKLTTVEALYVYPPVQSLSVPPPKPNFRFFRRFSPKEKKDHHPSGQKLEERQKGLSDWESSWEQTEHPFVVLEDNRAACAICLNDFEAPRKRITHVQEDIDLKPSSNQLLSTSTEEERNGILTLVDAGEGPQPLRLLQCGHVFHKTCLDPWLTNVSGRCPICQKPVELLPKGKKKERRRHRSTTR